MLPIFVWNHSWDFGVVFWAVYLVEMGSVAVDKSALKHSLVKTEFLVGNVLFTLSFGLLPNLSMPFTG